MLLLAKNDLMRNCRHRGAAIIRGAFLGGIVGLGLNAYRDHDKLGIVMASLGAAMMLWHAYGYILTDAISYVVHAKWRHRQ